MGGGEGLRGAAPLIRELLKGISTHISSGSGDSDGLIFERGGGC